MMLWIRSWEILCVIEIDQLRQCSLRVLIDKLCCLILTQIKNCTKFLNELSFSFFLRRIYFFFLLALGPLLFLLFEGIAFDEEHLSLIFYLDKRVDWIMIISILFAVLTDVVVFANGTLITYSSDVSFSFAMTTLDTMVYHLIIFPFLLFLQFNYQLFSHLFL